MDPALMPWVHNLDPIRIYDNKTASIHTMFLSIMWDGKFTATVKVTGDVEIHTLLAKIDRPLRHHIPRPDLDNIVFSLAAHGPALDTASTVATVFGPAAPSGQLYIGYRHRRSGRTARINYGE